MKIQNFCLALMLPCIRRHQRFRRVRDDLGSGVFLQNAIILHRALGWRLMDRELPGSNSDIKIGEAKAKLRKETASLEIHTDIVVGSSHCLLIRESNFPSGE